MIRRILVTAATATALVAVPAAVAQEPAVSISGTASGVLIPHRNGSYRIVGTFIDAATGQRGTFGGTFTETTTGFTTCLDFRPCAPSQFRCNIVAGELTVRFRAFQIANFLAILSRIYPGICRNLEDPANLDFRFDLSTVERGPVFDRGTLFGVAVRRRPKASAEPTERDLVDADLLRQFAEVPVPQGNIYRFENAQLSYVSF